MYATHCIDQTLHFEFANFVDTQVIFVNDIKSYYHASWISKENYLFEIIL